MTRDISDEQWAVLDPANEGYTRIGGRGEWSYFTRGMVNDLRHAGFWRDPEHAPLRIVRLTLWSVIAFLTAADYLIAHRSGMHAVGTGEMVVLITVAILSSSRPGGVQ